ncbi:mitochondrial import inner membrane translocase subunit tim-16 [Apiospora hydei]|uniref:Mitochondrial import inner membrane translocase subunit TIM16 n=1 Tax=Apiospora hydei TaxID=1337664 RepID=A0ABR1V883_9PEZI
MAHRLITQVVIVGSRVLGRAFSEAFKQAQASSNYARSQAKLNPNGTGRTSMGTGMTLDEACKILNVKPPQGGKANIEEVMDRFKRLFDANDPQKGGSFYLQSKVLRARERIEAEVRPAMGKSSTRSRGQRRVQTQGVQGPIVHAARDPTAVQCGCK